MSKNKNCHSVAILGFGVVGGGVADLIESNREELEKYLGTRVVVSHILDLRDFPSSPFASLVTHDFGDILGDPDCDTVIEVMGGSHPAYEYTVAALRAGKNVITSNKEVVAAYGDEFIGIAKEHGVSYRFEAAVGGGIPVIETMLSAVRQNKVREVRGILNGTTNYILTRMFEHGDSFERALADAQERGYAERNPDADILGTDACRKIAILTALATGILPDTSAIPTEGITGIRAEDVRAAEGIGHKIKLLGRCINDDGRLTVSVSPFLLPERSPLAGVDDVYNAVEIIASPLENIMLYGRGAGAGPTASAVVGDLIPIIAGGGVRPSFSRADADIAGSFECSACRRYIVLPAEKREEATAIFGNITPLFGEENFTFITERMTEKETNDKLAKLGEPISLIRFLD